MFDNPLTTLPPSNKPKLRRLPYENLDHLGRPALNPLQYLFYQPRYENELVNNEAGDVILIRPGYDKLTPATRKKRRENYSAQARRLECGKVDRNGLPVYDSLVREINLKCKSRREDVADSESENERNIHTIMEVPSSDERSPASSMDRSGNAETSKQLSRKDSDVDVECGCIGNDWNTSDEQDKEQQLTFKNSNGNLSPRSQAAFKMEDKTGLFESYSSDLTQDTAHEQSPC